METVFTVVVIAFLIFMFYSMIKYAKFIHHYPHQTGEEAESGKDDPPAESGGDDAGKG